MNAAAIHEEVSKQVGSFMDIMRAQPLSLALVIMNFALVVFLFYSNSQTLTQRQSALTQIVDWQQRTDQLMASCVSIEVMRLVVDALERDRELYRRQLPGQPPGPAVPVPQDKSGLEHLLPPGPKLQSDVSRPVELPPLTPLPTE
jgi:hypothetical protein